MINIQIIEFKSIIIKLENHYLILRFSSSNLLRASTSLFPSCSTVLNVAIWSNSRLQWQKEWGEIELDKMQRVQRLEKMR